MAAFSASLNLLTGSRVAARAGLLRRLNRRAEARDAYQRALELVTNAVEREYLEGRLAELG